jgi:hypothetical protein
MTTTVETHPPAADWPHSATRCLLPAARRHRPVAASDEVLVPCCRFRPVRFVALVRGLSKATIPTVTSDLKEMSEKSTIEEESGTYTGFVRPAQRVLDGRRAALSEARKIVRHACHILTDLGHALVWVRPGRG